MVLVSFVARNFSSTSIIVIVIVAARQKFLGGRIFSIFKYSRCSAKKPYVLTSKLVEIWYEILNFPLTESYYNRSVFVCQQSIWIRREYVPLQGWRMLYDFGIEFFVFFFFSFFGLISRRSIVIFVHIRVR